jgi:perosamine synthetase
MKVGRTLPPAATPIAFSSIVSGICGIFAGERALDRFRRELKEHFGVRHCFLVSSGKAALTLILRGLKELSPDRDEAVIPAFTCYSVPSSVVRAGLRIRLCDLHPDSLDLDFAQLSAMLSDAPPKLLAVVPTHLFGLPADVARLQGLVRHSGVAIVEDAAQAMGEATEDVKLGTLGDVAFFSLGRGKAFSVVEGGVILTNRDDLAESLNRFIGPLPRYGLLPVLKLLFKSVALMVFSHPRLFWIPRQLPFLRLGETIFDPHFPILRMSSFQAGLARNWRKRLESLRQVRRKQVNRWIAFFEASKLQGPWLLGRRSLGLLRFPLRVSDPKKRQLLLHQSAQMGLGIMPAYPTAVSAIPELKGRIGGGAFPVAEGCARELITLPTHGYLTEDDVTEVGRLVSRALGQSDLSASVKDRLSLAEQ